MSDRWFTSGELDAMGTKTLDALNDAIEAGDAKLAKKLSRRMYNEFLSQHDGYRNWVTSLFSEIGRRFGDVVLDEMMLATVKSWWLPNLNAMAERTQGDRRAQAKMFAAGLRGHLQKMLVSEDEQKVTIEMKPCGSGGRLVTEGKYEGENAFYKVPGPNKMSYGKRDFPVYCAHEAAMEEIDIDKNGRPFVVVEPAEEIGKQTCKFIIYKNPDDVPDHYYERLGKRKPSVDRSKLIASSTHER